MSEESGKPDIFRDVLLKVMEHYHVEDQLYLSRALDAAIVFGMWYGAGGDLRVAKPATTIERLEQLFAEKSATLQAPPLRMIERAPSVREVRAAAIGECIELVQSLERMAREPVVGDAATLRQVVLGLQSLMGK